VYIKKWMMNNLFNIGLIALLSWPTFASADTLEDLAKQAQNPVANLTLVPFQNNTSYGVGPYNRTQNVLNIEPVIPFALNEHWNLITRTIVPIVSQPNIAHPTGGNTGLGDINPTFFLSPRLSKTFTFGLGPTFLLPTATNHNLGNGKWGVGPGLVVVATPGHWVTGTLLNNIWSVAGQQDRVRVDQMTFQPFINYNLPGGWYVGGSPIITSNWVASPGDKWLVPLGGGIGRIFRTGSHVYVNLDVEAFYNVVTPNNNGSRLGSRLEMKLLFPS
jgi:hypothetical protein